MNCSFCNDNLFHKYIVTIICDMKQTREYILSEIKKTLQTVAPNAKAMLFGSRARNDAREDSDWDILILIEKDKIRNEDFDSTDP